MVSILSPAVRRGLTFRFCLPLSKSKSLFLSLSLALFLFIRLETARALELGLGFWGLGVIMMSPMYDSNGVAAADGQIDGEGAIVVAAADGQIDGEGAIVVAEGAAWNGEAAAADGQIDGEGAIVVAEGAAWNGQAAAAAEQHGMHRPQQPPSNQLTLSFQGDVYVFHDVQPERVQAVLLLLGGQELSHEVPGMTMADNVNHRFSSDFPRPCTNPNRLASIMRYRQKKKTLCFDKKVLYEVRKDVASRMKRHKGQFASSKENSKEVLSPSSSCEPAQSNSQEETVTSFCQNCGTGKDSTPMMRRGPAGPRSLCNACGLMWANKGTLRSLSQPSTSGNQNSPINPTEQSVVNDSDAGSNDHLFSGTSNGTESMMIASIDASMSYVDG